MNIKATPADPAPDLAVAPEELAARLASKLCHDFISPAGAIISGLDLLDDPAARDMREDAMELIASSARKLVDQLAFARAAYGFAAGVEAFDVAELERLTRAVFTHVRADLDWGVASGMAPRAAAQVLLNLAQLAAAALPLGGTASLSAGVDADGRWIEARAEGPKARLHAEALAGVSGQPLGDGLGGRWAPAYYAFMIAMGAGGEIAAESGQDQVIFRARLPL